MFFAIRWGKHQYYLRRVIELLKELDGEQKCFRLISDTLVEYRVKDAIPVLEKNLGNVSVTYCCFSFHFFSTIALVGA